MFLVNWINSASNRLPAGGMMTPRQLAETIDRLGYKNVSSFAADIGLPYERLLQMLNGQRPVNRITYWAILGLERKEVSDIKTPGR